MILQYSTINGTDNFTTFLNGTTHQQKQSKTINLDITKTYQSIIGFGGAFTEAAAYTYFQMSIDKRKEIINAYFGEQGLNYNIGRVHINSCDFSLDNYTYVEDFDTELKTFNIEREYKYVIPMIKEAEKVAGKKIKLLASPWSPPAWMKSNNDMNHGGKLLSVYFQTWANYYVKFIDHFKEAGLEIFAVTVQNEPAAVQVWDSCIYTAEEERNFVRDYLGPTLKKHHPEIKIIIWDHNRDVVIERADTVLKDQETRQYVWGTGVHWYVSEEFSNLSKVHKLHPDKHILFTEGCIEGGVKPNSIETGERYARNMIGDISNFCEGYLDWNLVLNEIGGPNHVGNYCDAPIICDTSKNRLTYNSSYHYIGHFSKYIESGAKRIYSMSDTNELEHVAFLNPNGKIVLVVLNETELDQFVNLNFGDKTICAKVARRSISTFIKGENL